MSCSINYKYYDGICSTRGFFFISSVKYGEKEMFRRHFPEFPEYVLAFSFSNGYYMTPEELKYFFKRIQKYFGKAVQMRSFTMYTGMYNQITFWIHSEKIGAWWQRIYAKIFRVDMSYYAVDFAEQLAQEFSDNLNTVVNARIASINRRD